ncbi:MAG TPA: MarR family transcriptional regulator [Rhodoglobus sp.]|jgi:DNA-binding MarR family transcriptional regulator|nr:MarR family transcriptional regulator [Rhodoglobus sp.]
MTDTGRYADELAAFSARKDVAGAHAAEPPMDTAAIAIALSGDPDEATLATSRALLGVIARSVAEALELVTLPQFRVLVILASSGPLRMSSLAARVKAVPSTFSRSIDRMEQAGWVTRTHSSDRRREVLVDLSAHGRQLVMHVTERRRKEIREILAQLKPEDRQAVGRALALFAAAAGEPPAEDLITLGV